MHQDFLPAGPSCSAGVRSAGERPAAGSAVESDGAVLDDVRVHIVDDDEAVRFALALLVESCGWQARSYASGEAFLAEYVASGRDCLILDLQMPGMSGADLQEALQARGSTLPTIVITAFTENELARRARTAGARAVLRKPFLDDLLLAEMRRALDLPPN